MFNISDKTYDALKNLAQVVLPAIATLYFTLSQIWGLPYAEQIVGTITSIDTFIGVLLKISTNKFNVNEEQRLVDEQYAQRIENGEFAEVDYTEGDDSNV
jgi:hypothetical protein